jgi:pimeloyl-ACP methyl ester carboxylesterase
MALPLFSRKRGRRYWRNIAFAALLSIALACVFLQYVAHPLILSYGIAHPARVGVCCVTPADGGLDYEDMSFTTSDGLTLRGWYLPSKNRAAVILLHPHASNRIGMLDLAVLFARRGYGVLLFDLRAHGESDGEVLPFGGDEAEDVVSAAAYLQTRADVDPEKIGAMGWSLGAQVAILGAARSAAVRAVAADAPGATVFQDWPPPGALGDWLYVPYDLVFFQVLKWQTGVAAPMPVRVAIAAIAPRPLLLIGGGNDQPAIEHLAASAGEPTAVWIIPEAGHIEGLRVRPQEYEDRVVRFFDEALLPSE